MEKGYAPTESAPPPYPGPPIHYPGHGQPVMYPPPPGGYHGGPPYPSAPPLSPFDNAMAEPAPPYPGPPINYPGVQPAGLSPQVGHQGGVFHAPVTVLRGPPFTSPPSTNRELYTPVGMFVQDVPREAECPHCHQTVVTQIEHTVGARTWLMCLFIAALGCWPCSCIPFCIDSFKDVKHRCPSCQRSIYF